MTLRVLGSTGHVFCRLSLSWDLSDIVLMTRQGLWAFVKKSTQVKCPFHSIPLRINTLSVTHHWTSPPSPGWGSVCQVSPLQSLLFSPISILFSFKGNRYPKSTLKSQELCTCSWRAVSTCRLKFFCTRKCSLLSRFLIYTIICFYQCGLINIHFILWTIIW